MVKGSIACTCVNLKKSLNEHFGSEGKQPVKHLCKLSIAILVQLTFKEIIKAELSQAQSKKYGYLCIQEILVQPKSSAVRPHLFRLLNLINWTSML